MHTKRRIMIVILIFSAVFLNIYILKNPWLVVDPETVRRTAISMESISATYRIYRFLLCVLIDVVVLICIFNIETLFRVPLEIFRDREMFWDLIKNDFQARFAGSAFGIIWAFVQPLIIIALYWFVFQVGLRAEKVSDYPFVLFLLTGLVPWFYFQESWSGATNCLMEYNYLVKKVVFNVGMIPVIKTLSSFFVHIFFVAFVIMMCSVYGYFPSAFTLQIIYYMICTAILSTGLSYITSACAAFFKDIVQVVNIILTIGVWLTPIMWNPRVTLPGYLQLLFRINPMYYIVDGYRDSLLSNIWFWQKPEWSIYFWIVTVFVYIGGVRMFNRLKGHFADVL